MPAQPDKLSLIIVVCLFLAGSVATDTALAQTKPAPPPKATQKTPPAANNPKADADDDQDTVDDELEAAAVTLDGEWIETDLLFAGTATSYALVDRPHVPRTTGNATGDVITTDGQPSIVELGSTKSNIINPATPVLQTRPTTGSQ